MRKKKGWPKTKDEFRKMIRECLIAEVAERSGLSEKTVKKCLQLAINSGWLIDNPDGSVTGAIPWLKGGRHE
jgi:hypothetical protein